MPEPSPQALVELRGVGHRIPIRGGRLQMVRGWASAAAGIDLCVPVGSTLGIVGPAASGKTTLLRLITRLVEPSTGTITYRGRDVTRLGGSGQRALRSELQVTFADPLHTFGAQRRVAELLSEPLATDNRSDGDAVARLLREVGLGAESGVKALGELSAALRQRVGLARALALDPALVALDEPLAGLEAAERDSLTRILVSVQEARGIAMVVSGHDPSHLRALLERTDGRLAMLDLGRIHEIGGVGEVLDRPVHPATVSLLQPHAPGSPRWGTPAPSALDIPAGCPFHTRCPVAEDRCSTETPGMRPVDSGHQASCHLV